MSLHRDVNVNIFFKNQGSFMATPSAHMLQLPVTWIAFALSVLVTDTLFCLINLGTL